jgi:hypothetical protein
MAPQAKEEEKGSGIAALYKWTKPVNQVLLLNTPAEEVE